MNRKLRIDFQVREVAEDGSLLPPEDSRYVTMGEYVELDSVKDFFERCGLSVDSVFNLRTPRLIVNDGYIDVVNKIAAIKLVRTLTNVGLKEAKDIVERPVGSAWFTCGDARTADAVVKQFHQIGANGVRSRPLSRDAGGVAAASSVPSVDVKVPFTWQ